MATSYNSRLSTAPEEGCKAPCRTVSLTNITLAGEQTIGAVAVVTGDRVLVNGQTDTTQNGIYDVKTTTWTRSNDWNATSDVAPGMLVPSSATEELYQVKPFTGDFVAGTTPITFRTGVLSTRNVEVQLGSAATAKVFTLSSMTYSPGTNNLEVDRNGQRLILNTDYTETSASTVTLLTVVNDTDSFAFRSNTATTNSATTTVAVSHTENGSTYNLADYLEALNYDTLADAVASTSIYEGAAVNLKERTSGNGGGAFWDVVLASTVTPNTFNIVQCTGVATLALVLRVNDLADVKQFGALADGIGVTDDTGAFEACRDYCVANNVVMFAPEGLYWFAGDLDLWGVQNIRFNGSITFSSPTNKVIIGGSTVSAPSLDIQLFESNGTIQIYGMNRGAVRFVSANTLHLFADEAVTTRKSVAYSTFEWVNVDTLRIGSSGNAFINDNKFFGGRVRVNVLFDGDYPVNNNIFYGTTLESVTMDFLSSNGTDGANSNFFHDVRLEGTNTLNFSSDSFNNILWQTWSNFPDTMMWDVPSGTYNITNPGNNNRIVPVHYAYIEKDVVVSYDRENLDDQDIFGVGTTDTSLLKILRNAAVFFDTGLIPATDKRWFTVFSGPSSPASLRMFLSPYDKDGALITTEPTSYQRSQGSTSWNGAGYWEYTTDVSGGAMAINPNADPNVAFVRCWARTGNGAINNEINFLKAEVMQPYEDKVVISNYAPTAKIDIVSNRVSATSESTAIDLFKFTSNAGSVSDAAGVLCGEMKIALTAEKGSDVDAASAIVPFQVTREDTSGILTIITGTPNILSNGGALQIDSLTFGTKAGATATQAIMTISIGTNLADPFDQLNAKARLTGTSDYMKDSVYLIAVEKA